MAGRQPNIETLARDAEILAMYRSGIRQDHIRDIIQQRFNEEAAQTGGKPKTFSQPAVSQAIKRALRNTFRLEYQDAQALELERLDELIRQSLRILTKKHYVVSTTGKLVYGPDGLPLEDASVPLAAIGRLQSLSESRRKLLGLDAPRRQIVEVVTEDAVDQQIAALLQELGRGEDPGHRRTVGEARALEGSASSEA